MGFKKIHKVALLIVRRNKFLVCKENGLDKYIMPGGKIRNNENFVECLIREINEELGAKVDKKSLRYLGKLIGEGEKNTFLRVELYQGNIIGELKPSSEIEVIEWIGKDDKDKLKKSSRFIRNEIIPFLLKNGIIK